MKEKINSGLRLLRLVSLSIIACLFMAAMPAYAETVQSAVVATVASDYSSSAVSVITVDPPRTPENDLLAQTTSDITLASYGRYFYLISRYGENSIAKLDIDEPETVIWQYSTDGDETNSNPYGMIFVSSEKAYIIRYGSTKVWVVDPSPESEDYFKTGELDLSAYVDSTDTDGAPEMAGAVIADGKLFIIMQRLVSWAPTDLKPYVAVFDTETDTEIDTGKGEGGLKGIPLDLKDPLAIQYLEENDTLYVQCVGTYYPDYYPAYEGTGGIVSIDPELYDTETVLDDGDAEDMPYGVISGMAIISSSKGYFVGYDGWGDNTLYSFDPSASSPTGIAITGLQNKGIAGMDSGIYTDKNGMLWVCNQTDARVEVLNTSTDEIEESVSTSLNPIKVVFTIEGFIEDDDNNNGIADEQEVGGAVDLDGDGTDDVIKDTYKFLQTEVGEAQIAMEATENVNSILTIASIDPADALADETGDFPTDMPYGLLDFSLDVAKGATVQVTLYFSESVTEAEWYKYNSTTGWEDYSSNAVFSEMSNGCTKVVLTLQDGGDGDADGEVNGIITDPSGPGSVSNDGSDDDDDDDDDDTCFINTSGKDTCMTMQPLFFVLLIGASLVALFVSRRSRD
ncbi:MAG: hypothetical protein JW944_13470 [Deltaproteobacteria bacterium]|nr:hypothetical protein [Deltaproteobacteria bacterium]